MLSDLETRLADVLGERLPAPFAGRVRRRGANAPPGNGPVVRVGVDAVEPLEPDLGAVRSEVVPGSSDARRVLRLAVTLGIAVETGGAGDPRQALQGIDALLYALQSPGMRSGELLGQAGDPGFVLDGLALATSDLAAGSVVVVRAEGLFWPVGEAGAAGRAIERALVREFRLPVRLGVGGPLVAGGADVPLTLTLGATGTMAVTAGGTTAAPFGAVALRLVGAGGTPGGGTLTGGGAGPAGARVVDVADGVASAVYGPPDEPGVERLLVSAFAPDAAGDAHLGVELARFDLAVTA